jgi:hypothetical protein
LGGRSGWQLLERVHHVGPLTTKTVAIRLPRALPDTVHIRLESSPLVWNIESAELAQYVGPAEVTELRPAAARLGNRDVTALLSKRDSQYVVGFSGDSIQLEYVAPPPRPGMLQTVLARTTGHYYAAAENRVADTVLMNRLMRDRQFSLRYFAQEWRLASPGHLH